MPDNPPPRMGCTILLGAGHVKDTGIDPDHKDPTTRIYLTRVAQPWHVDSTDMVGEWPGEAVCMDTVEDAACPGVQGEGCWLRFRRRISWDAGLLAQAAISWQGMLCVL